LSERILAMVPGHLGALVDALPALRELRRARPQARITAVVNEYVKGALDDCPYVNEVVPAFAYEPSLGHLRRKLSAASKLVGQHQLFLAFGDAPPSAPLIGKLAGAKIRVGYSQPGPFGRWLTRDLGPKPEGVSARERNLNVLRALGIEGSPSYSPVTWLSGPVRATTTWLLSDAGVGSRFAVLQLACNWGCNQWRSDKWAALAAVLKREHGFDLVVTGTGDRFQRAKLEEVSRLSAVSLISLQGRTSLPELFEVVRRASLVVATDRALTQIAQLQGTPAVSLPQSHPHCLHRSAAQGAYCHGPNCRENGALARTEVGQVAEEVRHVAGAKGRAASEA
jgi:heptosyltransferase-3